MIQGLNCATEQKITVSEKKTQFKPTPASVRIVWVGRSKQMETTRLSAAVHCVSVCHMSSEILVLLPLHCQGIHTESNLGES